MVVVEGRNNMKRVVNVRGVGGGKKQSEERKKRGGGGGGGPGRFYMLALCKLSEGGLLSLSLHSSSPFCYFPCSVLHFAFFSLICSFHFFN